MVLLYLRMVYTYLPGSTFAVNFTNPNKQLFNVKPLFKSLDHGSSV